VLFVSLLPLSAQTAAKAPTAEAKIARYLDSIRSQPLRLREFLTQLPKGADLHNHLSGAVYAESYIRYAARDGLCVNRKTLAIIEASCDDVAHPPEHTCATAQMPPAICAFQDAVLYRELIDAMSMRHFNAASGVGLYHFFDSFGKFGAVSRNHVPEMLAEAVDRAGRQNVSYIEFTLNLDRGAGAQTSRKLSGVPGLQAWRKVVDENGAATVVAAARKYVDEIDAGYRARLGCVPAGAQSMAKTVAAESPGCRVTVRYIMEVYRGLPKEQVFAQTQLGFELAAADPRVVSVNPVMPEDGFTSMFDFELHMQIFQFFHQLYPQVRLTMHAGELTQGLVPLNGPASLADNHIRQTVEIAGAERIGHGVDIVYERDPAGLLRELRRKNVMIEICLTSNDYILGVTGARHPLPLYIHAGVPVALATDDEGVSRSDITNEYQRAVESYHLSYADLKKLARTGLEHAFVAAPARTALLHDLDRRFASFEQSCCSAH
jgi:adenosine deaminase